MLRFDGVNDKVDFGDVLNMDATADFLFEMWVRVTDSDGNLVEFMGKKATYSDNTDGWTIYRSTSPANTLVFRLSDGASTAPISGGTTVLQNAWHHIAIAIDRNGNGTWYVDGAASGTPASVAAIGDPTNSDSFVIGKCATGSGYGQFDGGAVRVYNFGAGGLPSDIATIIANHYNAEKAKYGIA
jgi:hypothetical protein